MSAGHKPCTPAQKGEYYAALYMRLSKDDDGVTESASIATQRKMLRAYAKENYFVIAGEYIDDGWSGTNFDRPEFKRMIDDIEAKKINMVITKDFSRLGRDYITAGQYTEMFFPEHDVRFIAINDGYDSISPYSDIAPFKHVINEMYARDTSKRIRSSFITKMKEGCFIGNFAPYGYRKDPENKNHLIVDWEAAAVVRDIFRLAAKGERPSEIATHLNQCCVLPPIIYRCSKHPHLNPDDYSKRKEWTSSTICKILANVVYLGHTAQGKTAKPTFKSNITLRKPREEWYVVEHTHEPLVTQDIFDIVRKRSVSRRIDPKSGFRNVFSGVAKCADCHGNMSVTHTSKKSTKYNLVCGRYKLYGCKACSNHSIDYDLLYSTVVSEMREMLSLSAEGVRQAVLAGMEKAMPRDKANKDNKSSDLLKALESRVKELDNLIRRLYEDNVSGKISDGRFYKLNAEYEAEQHAIIQRIKFLSRQDISENDNQQSRRHYIECLNGLSDINVLTPELVKRMIDRIEIEQGSFETTQEGRKKIQTVRIFWQFFKE